MKKIKLFFALFAMLALGVGNAWGETTTLSTSNIGNSYNSSSTSYREINDIKDDNGFSYNAYAILNQHSKATSSQKFLQIKKYAKNVAYYIQIPTMPGNITSISMTVSSSSKAMDGGGNTATLYFSNSNSTSTEGNGIASGTGAESVTIDCSSLNLKEGFITAGGAVRIWDITITYETSGSTEPVVSLLPKFIYFWCSLFAGSFHTFWLFQKRVLWRVTCNDTTTIPPRTWQYPTNTNCQQIFIISLFQRPLVISMYQKRRQKTDR